MNLSRESNQGARAIVRLVEKQLGKELDIAGCMAIAAEVQTAINAAGAKAAARELRYYDALKLITQYDSPEKIEKKAEGSSGYMGLDAEEAISMAYDNIQMEAKNAIRGERRPKQNTKL